MEFLLSGKALTIISKDRFSKYRPAGWWQAEEYTKEEDRHSVAYGKGNILSHKSWLISHWALIAIATRAGSSVRMVWSVILDHGTWKGPKRAVQPHCHHHQPHFLLTSTQSSSPLCASPWDPPALHAFIHTWITHWFSPQAGKTQPAHSVWNYLPGQWRLYWIMTECGLSVNWQHSLRHWPKFISFHLHLCAQKHSHPPDLMSSQLLSIYYSIQRQISSYFPFPASHKHTFFFILTHSLITHLVSDVRSTPSVLSQSPLLTQLGWLFKLPVW